MELVVQVFLAFNHMALLNGFFENVADAEDRVRDSLEVDFPHLNLKNINLPNPLGYFLVIILILLNYRAIYFISGLIYSLNVFLNIINDTLDLLF